MEPGLATADVKVGLSLYIYNDRTVIRGANAEENEQFSAKNECYKSAGVCLGRLQFGIRGFDMLQKGKEGNKEETGEKETESLVIYHLRFDSSHLGTRRGSPK